MRLRCIRLCMDQGMTQHRRPVGWRRRISHGCLVSGTSGLFDDMFPWLPQVHTCTVPFVSTRLRASTEFVSQPYLGHDLTLLQPGCGFPAPVLGGGPLPQHEEDRLWLMDLVRAANFHLEHLNGARLERADARDASPHWDAQAPRRILIESSSKTFRYP